MFRHTTLLAALVAPLVFAPGVLSTAPRATHEIQLTGNRFTPAEFTVRAGDSVRFVNGRGGVHNVAFREDLLSSADRVLLDLAMPGREDFGAPPTRPLSSPMLIIEGEVYAFSVPALPPGRYEYFCAPHMTQGMRGTIVVAP